MSPTDLKLLAAQYEPQVEPDQPDIENVPDWPSPLGAVAYPGVVGKLLDVIEPETEADRVALLAHLLVAFGSCINRSAYFPVGGTWHHTNLFALCVGPTAKGRKGTAWGEIRRVFREIDETWAVKRCVGGGLVSGEGLIFHVRDPLTEDKNGTVVTTDAGETDKRLCVVDAEYSATLKAMSRETNTLSPILRTAWETGDLATLAKNSPCRATSAHVSIMGHVSKEELLKLTTANDVANGYLNRHLLFMVKRSKELPRGGTVDRILWDSYQGHLRGAVAFARTVGEMSFSHAAGEQWDAGYHDLSAEGPGGLLGAVLGRAEAQVLRLSMIYALLAKSRAIEPEHLDAAVEVWRYCAESGAFIFGNRLGDPDADKLYGLLLAANGTGRSVTDLSNALGRNMAADRMRAALLRLNEQGRAHQTMVKTTGRPRQMWWANRLARRPEREPGED